MTDPRTAVVVGTGLVGGSVGLALRGAGWYVVGVDRDPGRAEAALARGAIDEIGMPRACELAVVATPVSSIAAVTTELLEAGAAVVTDVGSVKGPLVAVVDDPRFVPGHPMAGNEQEGLEGADADLFRGAVWVLTPT
ncbi:MAG: prephenate dehydrogenase/arogenate dehydrogenase family protein, partial [Acidimicrobiales bacterium]